MTIDITQLMGPETAAEYFGKLFRGAPYNEKWAIMLAKSRPPEDWPFTVIEIDGRKFYRPKKGNALKAFYKTEFFKSIKKDQEPV